MIYNALAVFLGGALGALLRFLISEFLPLSKFGVPLTIMAVNFTGCFIMGFADSFFENKNLNLQLKYFLTVGLLGGFTTFSTFSLEFFALLKAGNYLGSFSYLSFSILTALAGFAAGYAAGKLIGAR